MDQERFPVLLTEPPYNPTAKREKMVEAAGLISTACAICVGAGFLAETPVETRLKWLIEVCSSQSQHGRILSLFESMFKFFVC